MQTRTQAQKRPSMGREMGNEQSPRLFVLCKQQRADDIREHKLHGRTYTHTHLCTTVANVEIKKPVFGGAGKLDKWDDRDKESVKEKGPAQCLPIIQFPCIKTRDQQGDVPAVPFHTSSTR